MSTRTDIRDAVLSLLRTAFPGVDVRVAPGVAPSEPRQSIAIQLGPTPIGTSNSAGPATLGSRAYEADVYLHLWIPVDIADGTDDFTAAEDAIDAFAVDVFAALESSDGFSLIPAEVTKVVSGYPLSVDEIDWSTVRMGGKLPSTTIAIRYQYFQKTGF